MGKGKKSRSSPPGTVTLKQVAERVGLAPGTVSAVLNDCPSARSIPQPTRLRIQAAVRELSYRPIFFARALRKKRIYTVGVIVEEIGDTYGSMIISGVEAYLRRHNYFFLTVVHRHDSLLLRDYSRLLVERGVEGFITVDTSLQEAPPLPTVSVAGHRTLPGVTNIVLDQERGARVALEHLVQLGHTKIAFMKGQPHSSNSADRWNAVCRVAHELGIAMDPDLVVRLEYDDPSPQVSYPYAKQLLARKTPRCSRTTTFRRWARSGHCRRQACTCPRTFLLWGSTTSSGPRSIPPASPPCDSLWARWGRSRPKH